MHPFSDSLFSLQKSIQKRYFPFFRLLMTIGALHGWLDDSLLQHFLYLGVDDGWDSRSVALF